MAGGTLNVGSGMTDSGDVTLDILSNTCPDVQATATHLPFDAETFDRVVMDQVLEHVPPDDVPDVLAEAYRVLVPGGRLDVWVPHAATRLADQDPTHRSRWTYRTPEYYADGNFSWYYDDHDFEFRLVEREVTIWAYPELPFSGIRSVLLRLAHRTLGQCDELLYRPSAAGSLHFTLEACKSPQGSTSERTDAEPIHERTVSQS